MKIRCAAAARFLCGSLLFLACAATTLPQAVPYARSYAKPKAEVEQALKELQAYSGQKLPILDGFVAPGSKSLDHYERGFYQYSIELLPGDVGATVVRLSAKITAWYVDRDAAKSGYEVLPSNGRLELDLLDRLQEKLTGKPVDPPATLNTTVQAPRPKLDLSGVPGAVVSTPPSAVTRTPDEVAALRSQRVAEERRVQQLTEELQNLKEIQHNQSRPQNLVTVTKSGTTVFDKPSENARQLFQAATNDEFEFLDAANGWIHITISGDSRGYVKQNAVTLSDRIAAQMAGADNELQEKFPGFRMEHEDLGSFPGDWSVLKGKTVKIFTVQPVSQNAKETGPAARLTYTLALFEKTAKEAASVSPAPEGVVVIFDAADGGIAGAAMADIQKLFSGALTREAFWAQAYLDPSDAFRPAGK
ncbi:MAG TPA: hypothetical protein VED66_16545 [Candidatus Sulfotelmatobacter sp.]|nr:hypothetical protein [Candidatus Sulfotelmatobacter sp.]